MHKTEEIISEAVQGEQEVSIEKRRTASLSASRFKKR